MPDVLAIIGLPVTAFVLLLWISPYLCKEAAAILLSHAEAIEVRRRSCKRLRKRLGLTNHETAADSTRASTKAGEQAE